MRPRSAGSSLISKRLLPLLADAAISIASPLSGTAAACVAAVTVSCGVAWVAAGCSCGCTLVSVGTPLVCGADRGLRRLGACEHDHARRRRLLRKRRRSHRTSVLPPRRAGRHAGWRSAAGCAALTGSRRSRLKPYWPGHRRKQPAPVRRPLRARPWRRATSLALHRSWQRRAQRRQPTVRGRVTTAASAVASCCGSDRRFRGCGGGLGRIGVRGGKRRLRPLHPLRLRRRVEAVIGHRCAGGNGCGSDRKRSRAAGGAGRWRRRCGRYLGRCDRNRDRNRRSLRR